MVEQDPWKVSEVNQQISSSATNELASNQVQSISHAFEDDFQPGNSDKLPDSQQYLKLLERKLAKLKTDSNILNQLKARHEQCIELLLQEKITLSEEIVDELESEESENSTRRDIIRFIQPEQPVRSDELHHLVDHDHLGSPSTEDGSEPCPPADN